MALSRPLQDGTSELDSLLGKMPMCSLGTLYIQEENFADGVAMPQEYFCKHQSADAESVRMLGIAKDPFTALYEPLKRSEAVLAMQAVSAIVCGPAWQDHSIPNHDYYTTDEVRIKENTSNRSIWSANELKIQF